MKKAAVKTILSAAVAIVFLAVVWLIAHTAVGNELLLPDLFDCIKQVFVLWGQGSFWVSLCSTLLRVLFAFLLSFLPACVLAVISYLLPSFGRFFAPIAAAVRSVPVLAVLLIVLTWSNVYVAPVIVAFLSLFPILYTGIYAALCGVDKGLIEISRVYGVPMKKRVFSLYLPAVLPSAVRESGAALSFGVKLVVSAEVLVRTAGGLGGYMQEALLYSEMPRLFALVIMACLLGFIWECAGHFIAKRLEGRLQ